MYHEMTDLLPVDNLHKMVTFEKKSLNVLFEHSVLARQHSGAKLNSTQPSRNKPRSTAVSCADIKVFDECQELNKLTCYQ